MSPERQQLMKESRDEDSQGEFKEEKENLVICNLGMIKSSLVLVGDGSRDNEEDDDEEGSYSFDEASSSSRVHSSGDIHSLCSFEDTYNVLHSLSGVLFPIFNSSSTTASTNKKKRKTWRTMNNNSHRTPSSNRYNDSYSNNNNTFSKSEVVEVNYNGDGHTTIVSNTLDSRDVSIVSLNLVLVEGAESANSDKKQYETVKDSANRKIWRVANRSTSTTTKSTGRSRRGFVFGLFRRQQRHINNEQRSSPEQGELLGERTKVCPKEEDLGEGQSFVFKQLLLPVETTKVPTVIVDHQDEIMIQKLAFQQAEPPPPSATTAPIGTTHATSYTTTPRRRPIIITGRLHVNTAPTESSGTMDMDSTPSLSAITDSNEISGSNSKDVADDESDELDSLMHLTPRATPKKKYITKHEEFTQEGNRRVHTICMKRLPTVGSEMSI